MRLGGERAQELAGVFGGRHGERVGLGCELAGGGTGEKCSGGLGLSERAGGSRRGSGEPRPARSPPIAMIMRNTGKQQREIRARLIDIPFTGTSCLTGGRRWEQTLSAGIERQQSGSDRGLKRNQDTFLGDPFIEPCPGIARSGPGYIRPVRSHGGRPENLSCGVSVSLWKRGTSWLFRSRLVALAAHLTDASPTKSPTFSTMRSAPRGNGKARRLSITVSKRTRAGRSFSDGPSKSMGVDAIPNLTALGEEGRGVYLPAQLQAISFPLSAGGTLRCASLLGLRHELSDLAERWELPMDDDGLHELLRVATDPDDGWVAEPPEVMTFARLALAANEAMRRDCPLWLVGQGDW